MGASLVAEAEAFLPFPEASGLLFPICRPRASGFPGGGALTCSPRQNARSVSAPMAGQLPAPCLYHLAVLCDHNASKLHLGGDWIPYTLGLSNRFSLDGNSSGACP